MRKFPVKIGAAMFLAISAMAPADPADVEAAHPDRAERDRGEGEARQPARPPAFFGLERATGFSIS